MFALPSVAYGASVLLSWMRARMVLVLEFPAAECWVGSCDSMARRLRKTLSWSEVGRLHFKEWTGFALDVRLGSGHERQ